MNVKIIFEYYDGFTGNSLGSAVLPYDRYKSLNGYYSGWWKIWKIGLANIYKLDKHWVRARIYKINKSKS